MQLSSIWHPKQKKSLKKSSPYLLATQKNTMQYLLKYVSNPTFGLILSALFILIGAIGLIVMQPALLEKSQDLRQQASVDQGQVILRAELTPTYGNNELSLFINTQSLQTDGVQLVFELWSKNQNEATDINLETNQDTLATIQSAITQTPEFTLNPQLNAQILYQEIEQVDNGYLFSLIITSNTIGQPFSTTQETLLGSVSFSYLTQEEINALSIQKPYPAIALTFDNAQSISTVFNSLPPQDQLRTLSTQIYTLPNSEIDLDDDLDNDLSDNLGEQLSEESNEDDVTNDNDTNNNEVIDTNKNQTDTNKTDKTENEAASNQSNSTSNNVGGLSNTSQSSNQSAQQRQIADSGQLGRSQNSNTIAQCNETCATNHQCAAGLACFSGRCRHPLNLENTACVAPNLETSATMAGKCNQSCQSHRDCPANMLCHASSKTCRLATNPGSLTCSSSSEKTVSSLYGSSSTNQQSTDSGSLTSQSGSIIENNLQTKQDDKGNDTISDTTSDTDILESDSKTHDKDTFIIFGITFSLPQIFGLSFPLLLAAISGLGLLLLLVLFILRMLISFIHKIRGTSDTTNLGQSSGLSPEERARQEKAAQELKAKITSLQKVQEHTVKNAAEVNRTSQKIDSTKPSTEPNENTNENSSVTQPSQSTHTTQFNTQPHQSVHQSSNMLDRIKQKGVSIPIIQAGVTQEPSQESQQLVQEIGGKMSQDTPPQPIKSTSQEMHKSTQTSQSTNQTNQPITQE